MLITHDTRCALDTVVDLVNTAPEDNATPDGLSDVAALEDFVRNHDISDVGTLSEFDLSAALSGIECYQSIGYKPASARKIVGNILAYVMAD